MNAEQKLLPCPWCHPHGSPMPHSTAAGHWTDPGYWAVLCGCGAQGPVRDTEAEAIAAWNTRPAPTEAEVEAAVARMAETPMQRGDFETVRAGEILSASELSDLARAALGKERG